MIDKYNFSEIEKKWQTKWAEGDVFKVTDCLLYTSDAADEL